MEQCIYMYAQTFIQKLKGTRRDAIGTKRGVEVVQVKNRSRATVRASDTGRSQSVLLGRK